MSTQACRSQRRSTIVRAEQIQKAVAIEVVAVDIAPLIAAAGDMPDGTWKLETKLTGH